MFEYLLPDGTALPENEVIKLAVQKGLTTEDYVKKNKLALRPKQKKAAVKKEVAKPAAKPVAKKEITPTLSEIEKGWGNNTIEDPLGLKKVFTKPKEDKTSIIADDAVKTVAQYNPNKFPQHINSDFLNKKEKNWWETTNIKDEDDVVVDLDNLLNTNKNNKDFIISLPTMPGIDMVTVKSARTGEKFDFSWDIDAPDKNLGALNEFVFNNSRYSKASKKEAAIYKDTRLSKADALEAYDSGAINNWALLGNAVKYVGNTIINDPIAAAKNIAEITKMQDRAANYKPLVPEDASDEEKINAVRSHALKIKTDVGSIMNKELAKNPLFKEKNISEVIKNETQAQEWIDSFILKNQAFVDKTGLKPEVIKKYVRDHASEISQKQNDAVDNETLSQLKSKPMDVIESYYTDREAKGLDPEDLAIYKANKNTRSLNEAIYRLRNSPKYLNNDPDARKQLGNLEAQYAKSKLISSRLSAEGSSDNNYFMNINTNKIAAVKPSKVDLNNNTAINITDKVDKFTEMYRGTKYLDLAKQFVDISALKEANEANGKKRQTVLIPKEKAQGRFYNKKTNTSFLDSLNNGVTTKILPNGDLIIYNAPTSFLAAQVNQEKLSNIDFFDNNGAVDIYEYANNKKGKKIDAKLGLYTSRAADLAAKSIAVNKLYLLNQSPTQDTYRGISSLKYAWDGLAKALNKNYTTSQEKVDISKNIIDQAGIKLTSKAQKELNPSMAQDVLTSTGSMLPTVAKIAAITALTEGASTAIAGEEAIAAFAALRNGTAAERAIYHIGSAIKEEGVMRTAGLGPTSGLTFYAAGQVLPAKLRMFGEFGGRGINNITSFMAKSAKGGVSMEAAGLTENAYHSINSNEKFQDYLDETYKDFGSTARRVIGNSLSFGILDIKDVFAPHFLKSGNQLEKTLAECTSKRNEIIQAIQHIDSNKDIPAEERKVSRKKLENKLEDINLAYDSVKDAHFKYAYIEAAKTPEGLENLLINENSDIINKYKDEYGSDLKIKVLDTVVFTDANDNVISAEEIAKNATDENISFDEYISKNNLESNNNSFFESPKINEKTGEVLKPGTLFISYNQVMKGGILNRGIIAHEFAHFADHVEIEAKVKKYKESDKNPTNEEVTLYKNNLIANKNKNIVDILAKNFPELMDRKIYSIKDEKTGEYKNYGLIDAVTKSYQKFNENGKLTNEAVIQDEIIKRVIEELGKGTILRNPAESKSIFQNIQKGISELFNKSKKESYEVQNADQLMSLLSDYATSFRKGKSSYKHSEALAKIDLSNFEGIDPAQKYEATYGNDTNLGIKKSKTIEERIDDLYDALVNDEIDQDRFEVELAKLEKEEQEMLNPSNLMSPTADISIKEKPVVKTEAEKTERRESLKDKKQIGDKLDTYAGPKDSKGNYTMSKEEWLKTGQVKAYNELIAKPSVLDSLIRKELTRNGVSADNVHGQSIDEFIDSVKAKIYTDTIAKFNPEQNNSFAGWVIGSNAGIKNRVGNIANSLKREIKGASIDVESGNAGFVNELVSGEEADMFTDIKTEEYAPKFKSLAKSNIVDASAMKSITEKLVRTTRTLKNRTDIATSINRSVEPIIQELLNEMSTQADIDLKTVMGGKKDGQLEKWLLKNKKAVLENATTTWLAGKQSDTGVSGGIPEAIQKRVNGEWLSYPDYIGKKIDRETMSDNNAGKTSGNLMVRRLPEVAKNVSDAVFISKILDPNGNPWRGAKESLSKEMAKELSAEMYRDDILNGLEKYYDLQGLEEINPDKLTSSDKQKIESIKQDIKDNNPIFDAFMVNQKNLGVIIGNVKASEIITQFERGTLKHSLELDEAVDLSHIELIDRLSNEKNEDKKREIVGNWIRTYSRPTRTYKWFDKETDTLLTTNGQLWDRVIFPALRTYAPELLDIENGFSYSKKYVTKYETVKGGIMSTAEVARNAEGKGLTLAEYIENYKLEPIQEEQGSILYKNKIAEEHRFVDARTLKSNWTKNKDKVGTESTEAQKIALDLMDYYMAKDPTGKEFKKILQLIRLDQSGLFRKIASPGLEVVDLKPNEKWLEHDPPVQEAINEIYKHIEGKIERSELENFLTNSKVNLIPKRVNELLAETSFRNEVNPSTGEIEPIYSARMRDPLVISRLYEYKDRINNLEAYFGSEKEFKDLAESANKIIKSGVLNKENIQQSKNIEAIELASSPDYGKEKRKIRVFDFDDTLAKTKSNVLYTMPGDRVIYHGAPKGKDVTKISDKGVKFFATDKREANEYARMNSGVTQEFLINDSDIVNEDGIINKINELGLKPKNKEFEVEDASFYELIDTRFDESLSKADITKLFDALKKDGVKAISYNDGAQVSGRSTTSIAVIDPSIISAPRKLTGAEFASKAGELANDGATFDFSDFVNVREGSEGPLFKVAKVIAEKRGTNDLFVLTARPADAAGPIQEFLSTLGLDIPIENITGLGNSSAQAKADWITNKVTEGYNDFYFADDHIPNVQAVKDALSLFDVKSRVQQAKAQFSKNISTDFNKILEENVGVKADETFSAIVAKRKGKAIGKYRFFVPPSAADLELLTYDFLGYGKTGERQQEFFNKALFEPYAEGIALIDSAKQSIKNDYKALLKSFPEVSKELGKLTPDGNFTYDQAIRVSMWAEMGEEIPGISDNEVRELNAFVNQNPDLAAFKTGLIATGRQGNGWVKPTEYWDSESIVSDLHNITDKVGRNKYLAEFIANSNEMFSKENLNKIEARYGSNFREALEDSIYSMANGTNRESGPGRINAAWLNWINNSTGAIMFFNTRSAVLQTVGAINYLNWRDNNPLNAAKAFANQPQYWKDFAHIWNSDKMKERRGGLKEDVSAAEIANAAQGTKSKANAVVSYLLKLGYTPTQIGDSFAIASGGSPFYRNRIEYNLKQGMSEAEAEAAAWKEFVKVTDQTQQSGDPRDVSQQQRSTAGRLILAFQNTSMQQARLVKKAGLDLINNRGDAKTNISKIVYYTAVQNIIFGSLQSALFATMFSDDTEAEQEKKNQTKKDKWLDIGNNIVDTILRGSGITGAIVATLKNVYLKYNKESKKGFKAEYAKVLVEAANVAPAIGSKLSKGFGAMRTREFEKDVIAKRGWSVTANGKLNLSPSYSVLGQGVEATTNLPMNRFVNKVNNLSEALDSRNKSWQRIALAVGYSPYVVGVENEENEAIKAEAKVFRKQEGLRKAEETRTMTRDSLNNLPFDEFKAYVLKKKMEKIARKDSINNLPKPELDKYLKNKKLSEEFSQKQKDMLELIKLDSLTGLSRDEYQNYLDMLEDKKELAKIERKITKLKKEQRRNIYK